MQKRLQQRPPRVAIVYDRVNTKYGGAEYVLSVFHEIFPDAPLFTSVFFAEKVPWVKDWSVRTSFLQQLPFAKRYHRIFVPLMPLAFESFDFSEFDIVISVTSAEAKGIITSAHTLHVCYLLTPTRYLWSHHLDYAEGLFSRVRSSFFSLLRNWDYIAAQRPDILIPISRLVKKRAEKYYQRTCQPVIYPPFQNIDSSRQSTAKSKRHFLVVSRLVDYKNINLAVRACAKSQEKLIIVGDGPERKKLEVLIHHLKADAFITILSNQTATELQEHYNGAHALLLLAEEDFGLVALEAQSIGIPVIVNQKSGAAEVVEDGKTGVHCASQTVDDVIAAMYSMKTHHWKKSYIQRHAQRYNTERFKQQFSEAISSAWQKHLIDE